MPEPDYMLTIFWLDSGGYAARIDSSDGDLWAGVRQEPQEGSQFRQALIAFAERYQIPWEEVEAP